jgi:hypothetical protein
MKEPAAVAIEVDAAPVPSIATFFLARFFASPAGTPGARGAA